MSTSFVIAFSSMAIFVQNATPDWSKDCQANFRKIIFCLYQNIIRLISSIYIYDLILTLQRSSPLNPPATSRLCLTAIVLICTRERDWPKDPGYVCKRSILSSVYSIHHNFRKIIKNIITSLTRVGTIGLATLSISEPLLRSEDQCITE